MRKRRCFFASGRVERGGEGRTEPPRLDRGTGGITQVAREDVEEGGGRVLGGAARSRPRRRGGAVVVLAGRRRHGPRGAEDLEERVRRDGGLACGRRRGGAARAKDMEEKVRGAETDAAPPTVLGRRRAPATEDRG